MKFSVFAIAALAAASSFSCFVSATAAAASRNRKFQKKTSSSSSGAHVPHASGHGATEDSAGGQPGSICTQTNDCVKPTGLDHPVCRDGYCQDGTPGASCGVQSDCIVLPGRSNNICRNGKCTEDGTVDTPVSTFTPAAPLETFKSVRTNEEKQYKQKRILALLTSRCNLKSNSTCSCFLHTIHVLTSTSKSDQTNRIADWSGEIWMD